MSNQLAYNQEAREYLQAGIDKVANAVKVTLGPRGRNVIIDKPSKPVVTNDGVTIAKAIELKDNFENVGAKLIKEVASKAQDGAGDGTTTATVLAQAMILQGLKNVTAGANPIEIKRGIEQVTEKILSELKALSKPVNGSDDIAQVATISANNDESIGKLIAQAMEKVGSNGVITVEEAKSFETHLDVVEGLEFDKGYVSPYMATDAEKQETHYSNASVLVTDKKLSSVQDLIPVLELAQQQGKPLVIVAEDVEGEALTALVLNILRGGLKVVAIKAPGFGDAKTDNLEDLAALTGAKFFKEDQQADLKTITPMDFGSIASVTVKKDKSVFVSNAESDSLASRVSLLEARINAESNATKKEQLQKRLAKLTGGVAVINVGAATETELKEKKMRIDDALHATKAAAQEGVVVGGGLTLFRIAEKLRDFSLEHAEQQIGVKLVLDALSAPMRQIALNAGVEGAEVVSKVADKEHSFGYNARTNEYVDLSAAGVIDPTKVVRNGVQAATSIAAMVLTTETLVAELDEDNKPLNPAVIL